MPAPQQDHAALGLLGREVECDALQTFLDDVRALRGGARCITGPPGIGKTALVEWTMAAATGWRVLHLRASRGREMLAYSGLAELLSSSPINDAGDLGPIDRILDDRSGEMLEPSGPAVDMLSMSVAALNLLTRAAEREPLLVVVDDAQWLDASSAEVLSFIARRIEGDAIAMLFGRRDGESGGLEPRDIEVVALSGLSDAAAMQLAAARVASDVARQVAAAAAGNPLAIIEGCRRLTDAQRRGWEPINRPLTLPADVERAYTGRLDALPEGVRTAILVVACDERLDARVVVSTCRALGASDADGAVASAMEHGLLRESAWGLSLDHPLLGSAVYGTVDAGTRRAAHASIAAILRRDADVERRAWHLANACDGTDEATAQLLDEAGSRALARGDAYAAAVCFVRARALSEDSTGNRRRLSDAGDAFSSAGRLQDALDAYGEALALADDTPSRVDLLVRRLVPGTLRGGSSLLVAETRAEIESLRGSDPGSAAVLAVYAAFPAFLAGDVPTASWMLETARELDPEPDPTIDLIASGLEASVRVFQADTERALPVLRRIAALPGIEEIWTFTPYIANLLSYCDDFARAERTANALLDVWRPRRAPGVLSFPLLARAEVRVRTGRFMDARADADEAYSLASAASRPPEATYALCAGARAEACLGRSDAARAMAQEAVRVAERLDIGFVLLWGTGALGFVELTERRVEDAIAPLEHCAELATRYDLRLASPVPWGPDLVEAYVRSDRRALAVRLVDRLTTDAGSHPTVWTEAALERCRGLIADADDFDRHFEAALVAHGRIQTPFETARTHLCYGERLLRARRSSDAAAQLEQAASIFGRLHAPRWRERAEVELGVSTRSRSESALDSLTPREYQAARAVVDGARSRDAAASLFISTRTLEHHLANVYRKLGVRSRTQLANVFREAEAGGGVDAW